MKYKTIPSVILILVSSLSLMAQVMIRAEPGKVLRIEEIQSVIIEKQNAIVIEAVLPVETRLERYRDVMVNKNDTVLMANGVRIGSVRELEKMYRDHPAGTEFKLGIRRKDGLHILAFEKASADDFPKKRMMKMTVEDEDGAVTKKVVDEAGNEWTGEDAEKLIRKMKKGESDSASVRIEIEETEP